MGLGTAVATEQILLPDVFLHSLAAGVAGGEMSIEGLSIEGVSIGVGDVPAGQQRHQAPKLVA